MKVFISYEPQANEDVARKLSAGLAARGISSTSINLLIAYDGRMPKSMDALDEILRECDHVVPLLSPDYINSRWLQKELSAFAALEITAKKPNLIIPAIIEKCEVPPILDDKITDQMYADFTKGPFDKGVARLASRFSGVRRAFVIIKYRNRLMDEVFSRAIEPVLSQFGYTPVRTDKTNQPGEITAQIYEHLDRSELVVSDLTCESPNCYFETGYARALRKPLILTAKEGTKIPFNLTTHHFLFWRDAKHLARLLREQIQKIVDEKDLPAKQKSKVKPRPAPRARAGKSRPASAKARALSAGTGRGTSPAGR